MKCFNCGGSGHTAKNCKKAVICHKCKKTGHISSNCPQANNNFNQCYTLFFSISFRISYSK